MAHHFTLLRLTGQGTTSVRLDPSLRDRLPWRSIHSSYYLIFVVEHLVKAHLLTKLGILVLLRSMQEPAFLADW